MFAIFVAPSKSPKLTNCYMRKDYLKMNTFIIMTLLLIAIGYVLNGLLTLIWNIVAFIFNGIKVIAGHLDTIKKLITGEIK